MNVSIEINTKAKADGEYKVFIRIAHYAEKKRIDTGYSVNKKFWKKRKGQRRYFLSKNAPNYDTIEKLRKSLHDDLETVFKKNPNLSLQSMLDIFESNKKQGRRDTNFFKYSIDYINNLTQESSSGYHRSLTVCLRNFAEFLFEIVYSSKDIRDYKIKTDINFTSITIRTLNDFEHWMKVKGMATNTVYINLKSLRTFFNRAVKEDVLESNLNPFKRKTLRTAKTKKKAITLEEIKNIENCKKLTTGEDLARDMFLFSFYCAGLRWGDVCTLKWNNVNNGVLTLVTRKTASSTSAEKKFTLNEKALKILDKYRSKESKQEGHIFPMLKEGTATLEVRIGSKNALVNKYLKQVAKTAKVTSDLSFHMSRHSFATLALHKDTPIAIISQLLGHSDIKTTEIYLKELDYKRVSEAHLNILDY